MLVRSGPRPAVIDGAATGLPKLTSVDLQPVFDVEVSRETDT